MRSGFTDFSYFSRITLTARISKSRISSHPKPRRNYSDKRARKGRITIGKKLLFEDFRPKMVGKGCLVGRVKILLSWKQMVACTLPRNEIPDGRNCLATACNWHLEQKASRRQEGWVLCRL